MILEGPFPLGIFWGSMSPLTAGPLHRPHGSVGTDTEPGSPDTGSSGYQELQQGEHVTWGKTSALSKP